MRQERIPVLLLLLVAHGQHPGRGVVDKPCAAIGAWVLRARVDFVDAKALVCRGVGELGGKVKAVVGDERDGGHPKRYVLVDEDVGVAGGGELACCHRVNISTAAKAVGEEKNLGVAAWCKGQRAEEVDADGDAWVVG